MPFSAVRLMENASENVADNACPCDCPSTIEAKMDATIGLGDTHTVASSAMDEQENLEAAALAPPAVDTKVSVAPELISSPSMGTVTSTTTVRSREGDQEFEVTTDRFHGSTVSEGVSSETAEHDGQIVAVVVEEIDLVDSDDELDNELDNDERDGQESENGEAKQDDNCDETGKEKRKNERSADEFDNEDSMRSERPEMGRSESEMTDQSALDAQDPELVDAVYMFDSLREATPASEALEANARVPARKGKGAFNRVPKLKNLTRDLKREKRKMRSHIKGKVIDGKHEQYALSIGMMLGIRVAVGGREKWRRDRRTMSRRPGEEDAYEDDDDTGKLVQVSSCFDFCGAGGGAAGAGPGGGTDVTSEESQSLAPLELEDFMLVEKYVFPPKGNNIPPFITPPHKLAHTFKFKAYAPEIFSRIRAVCNVDPHHFMLSVCGEYNFIEFVSNAKSGQFFFYSHDGRYLIKTQTSAESKFLRRIMPHYFQYMCSQPHNFLTHFYGMYRVKMKHLKRNVHFVIMKSVFSTDKEMHRIWDLKGSLVGRRAKETDTVKKDLDILESDQKLTVGPDKKELIMRQLSMDVAFLKKLKIMDYSLLLGAHNREQERLKILNMDSEELDNCCDESVMGERSVAAVVDASTPLSSTPLRKKMLEQMAENTPGILDEIQSDLSSCSSASDDDTDMQDSFRGSRRVLRLGEVGKTFTTFGFGGLRAKTSPETPTGAVAPKMELKETGAVTTVPEGDEAEGLSLEEVASNMPRSQSIPDVVGLDQLPTPADARSGASDINPITARKDLGIESVASDPVTLRSKEIYYFGVIDILQQYTSRKRAETIVKRSRHGTAEISCVDPITYGDRFLKFVEGVFE